MVNGDRTDAALGPHVIACPQCDARQSFHRDPVPAIDSCGFESYSFQCKECGASLGGIIDPCDETLLLCILPPDDEQVRPGVESVIERDKTASALLATASVERIAAP